jgi:hypothetical protein
VAAVEAAGVGPVVGVVVAAAAEGSVAAPAAMWPRFAPGNWA